MPKIRHWAFTWLIIFSACTLGLSVHAVTPDTWKDTTYSYRESASESALLGDVLYAFAKSMGLKVKVAPNVAIRQKAMIDSASATPTVFMDKLASMHGLSWFVHDGVLNVANANEFKIEKIPLGNFSPAVAKQALQGLGIFEQKFGWGEVDDTPSFAIVSGPAAYIQLVRSAIENTDFVKQEKEPVLMVFKLKHASAADTEYTLRDKTIARLGVASLLKRIMQGEKETPALDSLRGMDTPPTPKSMGSLMSLGTSPSAAFSPKSSRRTYPSIEAYAAQNAVVILDRPEKRDIYETLLASLDTPVRKIEIVATILDAEVGTLREWSAGLSLSTGARSFSTQTGGGANVGNTPSANSASANPTVLLSLDDLSLRIRALQSSGKLEVLSKPSVLTLENNSAVLDMSESAIFKLVGERAVDIRTVTVGTMLKVIPRVLDETPDSAIRIDIDIEDGSIQNYGNGTATPSTAKNTISTQAIVLPNQALVIGGYQRDQSDSSKSHVPVLSDIPFFGALFRSNATGQNRRERLYVLTARTLNE